MGKHSKKKTENTRPLSPREEPKTRDPYEDWFGAAGRELDFAEVFSTYVTSTPEEFQFYLDHANEDGRNKIQRKLRIVRDYFADNWELDIDALRDEIQERETHLTDVDFDDISL